jgi:hypothetical protein
MRGSAVSIVIILSLAAVVVVLLVNRQRPAWQIEPDRELHRKIDLLAQKLELLSEMATAIAEIADWTAPPVEKARRRFFERAHPLTASVVTHSSPGDVIRIIEMECSYPSLDPLYIEFDFELKHISQEHDGIKVSGRAAVANSETQPPITLSYETGVIDYSFMAGSDGATNNLGSTSIKGIPQGLSDPLRGALLDIRSELAERGGNQ